jgi:hypothetical protein
MDQRCGKISQSNDEIGFDNDKEVHASVTQITDPHLLRFWSASRMKEPRLRSNQSRLFSYPARNVFQFTW